MIEWLNKQFTKERMVRWLDGCNSNRVGWCSFVQLITWNDPRLWSCVHVTTPKGMRQTYYLTVHFVHSQKHFAAAVLSMRVKRKTVTSTIHFDERENAPKKLNKAIRSLRAELSI
jgi:hypothetical protein